MYVHTVYNNLYSPAAVPADALGLNVRGALVAVEMIISEAKGAAVPTGSTVLYLQGICINTHKAGMRHSAD